LSRTASAACRSVRFSTICNTVTIARRPGDHSPWPPIGERLREAGVSEHLAQLITDHHRQRRSPLGVHRQHRLSDLIQRLRPRLGLQRHQATILRAGREDDLTMIIPT
jgi:hypothetical protein